MTAAMIKIRISTKIGYRWGLFNLSRLAHKHFIMQITPYSHTAINDAAQYLRDGRLVAFPTETVYGLGAVADDDKAVARIFAAKNRPQFNPLISHFADRQTALAAGRTSQIAQLLAAQFMPGPLTLILQRAKNSTISQLASAGTDTIAVRVPAHPIALHLLEAVGRPVVAPSANPSGQISPSTAQHVLDGLGSAVDMILDGGPCQRGLESTVIDCRNAQAVILRPGPITPEDIEKHTGLKIAHSMAGQPNNDQQPVSPGQMTSHYAPKARVRLNAKEFRENEIFIGFGPMPPDLQPHFNLSATGDLIEAASMLFAIMHEADKTATKSIAFAPIPMSGLGITINDRLVRAAAAK